MPIKILNKQGQRNLYDAKFIAEHEENELLCLVHQIICFYPILNKERPTGQKLEKLNSFGIATENNRSDKWPYVPISKNYHRDPFKIAIEYIKKTLSCSEYTAWFLRRWLFLDEVDTDRFYLYPFDPKDWNFEGLSNNKDFQNDLKKPAVKFLVAAIYENLEKFDQAVQYYFEIGQESPELRVLALRAIDDILEYENNKGEIEENVQLVQVKAAECFLEGYQTSETKNTAMIDRQKAVKILQKDLERKEKPFALSFLLLGKCYRNGWGVDRDLVKAKENFAKAKNILIDAAIAYAMVDYEENTGNPEELASATAKELHDTYKVHKDKKDSNKILLQLEKLAESYKKDKEVQQQLSECYLLVHQFDKALQLSSEITGYPSEILTSYTMRIHRLWGDYLLGEKQFTNALKHAETISESKDEIDTYKAKIYFEWGTHLKNNKKFSDATEKYQQAIALQHPHGRVALGENYYLHGKMYLASDKYNEAKVVLTEATKCGNLPAHILLADLYLKGSITPDVTQSGKAYSDHIITNAAQLFLSTANEESFLSTISDSQADEYFKLALEIDKTQPLVLPNYLALLRKSPDIKKKLITWRNQLIYKELASDCSALKRGEYIWQINTVLLEVIDFKNAEKELGGIFYLTDIDKKDYEKNYLFVSLLKNYNEFHAALDASQAPEETVDKSARSFFSRAKTSLTNSAKPTLTSLAKNGNLIANSLLISRKRTNLTFSPATHLLKEMTLEKWKFYAARALCQCELSKVLHQNFIHAISQFKIGDSNQLEISQFSLALYLLKFPNAIIANENLLLTSIQEQAGEFFIFLKFWLENNNGISLDSEVIKTLLNNLRVKPEIAKNTAYQELAQLHCPPATEKTAANNEQEPSRLSSQNTYVGVQNKLEPTAPRSDEKKKAKNASSADIVYEDLTVNSSDKGQEQIVKANIYEELTAVKKRNKELEEQNIAKDNEIKDLKTTLRATGFEKDLLIAEKSQWKVEKSALQNEKQQLENHIANLKQPAQQSTTQTQPVNNSSISAETVLTQMSLLFTQQQNAFQQQMSEMQKQNQQQIAALQQQVQTLTQLVQSLSKTGTIESIDTDSLEENNTEQAETRRLNSP